MSIVRSKMRQGMDVIARDGVTIGQVERIGDDTFTVDRTFQPAVTLPFTSVHEVKNGQVTLLMPARQISETSPPSTNVDAPASQRLVHRGMPVMDADGQPVGTVRELRGMDFLVERPLARDVFVPFNVIRDVANDHVFLQVPAGQIDNMGWPGI